MTIRFIASSLLAVVILACPTAHGRDIDLGGPAVLRFDNTLRYNLGVRTDPVNPRIGANPLFTNGEYAIAQGSLSANRLDLLSELDLSYEDRFGIRVSAAGWYDQAYSSGTTNGSPALAAQGVPGSYVDNQLSDFTRHRYRGPWGEILDAFGFARMEMAGIPVTWKVGRHAVSWGESLMLGGALHGVSYAQMPLDLQKGFATPGVEAKELFRPLGSVSMQAQVLPTLSVAAQYFVQWESYLYPEGGTFLGAGDFAFNGPDRAVTPAGTFVNAGVSQPRNVGEWGAAVRWSPPVLDATAGAYYRRYTDKIAAVLVLDGAYRQYYGENIDLFGVSVSKQVLGTSVGGEVSYRHNTPLLARSLGPVVPGAQLIGNTYQARGDTLHALLNAVGVASHVPGVSITSWAVELTYSRWLTVRDNAAMFYGEGYGACDPALGANARDRSDGCATRDHVGVSVGVTPTWLRVFSGVDLLAPLTVSWTIRGNSPVTLGGNENSGTYGVGVAIDVRNQYRVDLRYVDFFGSTKDNPTGTVVTSSNGQLALLQNRGSVTLTAKATF